MTGWRLFHLKNEMLAANFPANFIGAEPVQSLLFKAETHVAESLWGRRRFNRTGQQKSDPPLWRDHSKLAQRQKRQL